MILSYLGNFCVYRKRLDGNGQLIKNAAHYRRGSDSFVSVLF